MQSVPRRRCVLIVGLSMLPACGSASPVHRDVAIHDASVVMPTLRFTTPRHKFRRNDWGTRFEGEMTRGAGSVGGGDAKGTVDDVNVVLRLESPWSRGEPEDFWASKGFRLAPYGGVDVLKVDAEDKRVDPEVSEEHVGVGLLLGVELAFAKGPLDFYGRASLGVTTNDTTSSRFEVGVQTEFGSWIDGFVGYRWWDLTLESRESDTFSDYETDIDLDLRGVVIGCALRF